MSMKKGVIFLNPVRYFLHRPLRPLAAPGDLHASVILYQLVTSDFSCSFKCCNDKGSQFVLQILAGIVLCYIFHVSLAEEQRQRGEKVLPIFQVVRYDRVLIGVFNRPSLPPGTDLHVKKWILIKLGMFDIHKVMKIGIKPFFGHFWTEKPNF